MMKTTLMAAGIALAAAIPKGANAQLHESVSVDGTYVPDIIMLDRLAAFPSRVALTMTSTPLPYDLNGVPASFIPSLPAMPATGWRTTRTLPTTRGYIDLGAGSWLNSTLSAGYRIVDTSDCKAGIRLQHNSTSLWRPHISDITENIHRKRYDENIGVYLTERFSNYGTLEAALDWHYGYFNYYGYRPIAAFNDIEKAPTQTLNDVSLRFGWNSRPQSDALQWHASADMRHFAYRALPLPVSDSFAQSLQMADGYEEFKGDRETHVQIRGGIAMPWDEDTSTAALDARFDIVGYAEREAIELPLVGIGASPDTYAMLTLSPWYRFSRGLLHIKAGVDVDLAFNADGSEPDSHYSLVHVAPAIMLDWRSNAVGLYAHLTGGSQLQTLASGYELDYYQLPAIVSTQPVHTPLDARFGMLFGPFSGFSAGAEVAYRIDRHRRDGGWYQIILNQGVIPVAGLDTEGRTPYLGTTMSEMTVKGFSAGLDLAYNGGDVFNIHGQVHYQPQKGTTGYFNGLDRPRITACIEAEVNPWSTLRLGVQYDYRGVRNIYSLYPEPTNTPGGTTVIINNVEHKPAAMRLPDITELSFKARYAFTPAVSIWLQADNLLNRRHILLPGLPTEGVSVTGGVQWLF
ncbi:MAG: hypothetical protein K2K26_05410 [Muribaculaceae bacterium]|nr:hypothetical protein [Muribaculaceae bacterium]